MLYNNNCAWPHNWRNTYAKTAARMGAPDRLKCGGPYPLGKHISRNRRQHRAAGSNAIVATRLAACTRQAHEQRQTRVTQQHTTYYTQKLKRIRTYANILHKTTLVALRPHSCGDMVAAPTSQCVCGSTASRGPPRREACPPISSMSHRACRLADARQTRAQEHNWRRLRFPTPRNDLCE